jgi:enediyne polyketide synthase
MSTPIAIVGIACRYPDASSPADLWENVLAGRRAFRRIPDERLRLDDYWSPDPAAPDKFYSRKAAVIDGFEFDRVKYKVAGSTFRTTDMTHWLALDTAARALEDAGFADGDGLPKASTLVIVGNSLAGEFTRANLLRLRWPYVRRTLSAALAELGWDDARLAGFLAGLEERYKSAFPPVDEDTLAGGLSNTIAGRICNHFDLGGGGFTVDGACSSSLLSVVTACAALSDEAADAAVAGGVDLSIDPFEIIGFAKTGALATGEMRVYDRNSNGFWPGEGCGMLVLMRRDDAEARGLRSYATISGWGYSSDGKGGITRPEAHGHELAISRAYRVAGYDFGTVGYLEGHGTGTAVGDATELAAFTSARRAAAKNGATPPAAISTIKGNIGHTKAAAGVAGLIKAIMAVHHQVIPPATGHVQPAEILTGEHPALRVPLTAELWPDGPVRAGVSSMGFGGINAHVALEGDPAVRRTSIDARTRRLVSSRQDCEVLLLAAQSTADLRGKVAGLAELCERLAFAELGDLAASLAREPGGGPVRAAVVASSPDQAAERLGKLLPLLTDGGPRVIDAAGGLFAGSGSGAPRIGFLFPGQGSGTGTEGALRRRFGAVLPAAFTAPAGGDVVATAIAQPRIVRSSVDGLRILSRLGIEADAAVGHSLGELTALHWAGAMDEASLVALATERGRVMAEASAGGGAMAGIAASPELVESLLSHHGPSDVVIAGYNGPGQTVISGPAGAVERICRVAADRGHGVARIRVSHAFHSPAVEPAAEGLARYLAGREFGPLTRRVLSTVTGAALPAGTDVPALLISQVRDPVRFSQAAGSMAADADLFLEVGPGRVLSALAEQISPEIPVVAVDTDGSSLAGLLAAVAAAYVLGAPVRSDELFADRFTRPFPLDKTFRFFASPCESVPADTAVSHASDVLAARSHDAGPEEPVSFGEKEDSLEILRRLAAERAELPLETVRPSSHLLDELHLSSITVGQIMNQAAKALGVSAPTVTSSFATATLEDLAGVLEGLADTALPGDGTADLPPDGVEPWVRAFTVELTEQRRPARAVAPADGEWEVFTAPGHPLSEPLGRALRAARLGDGVALVLPADCGEEHLGLMLLAARSALSHTGPCRFLAVQDRRGAAGLAKTLHLEAPGIPVTVVTLPVAAAGAAGLADAIAADVAANDGFSEVHYDAAGTRTVPLLRPVTGLSPATGEPPLTARDVLLVSGGGKGITAECALALARDSGAAIAILGRSDSATDAELGANLRRMAEAGVRCRYYRADVTSPADVAAAVAKIGTELGQVTAVLHGAGRNMPCPLASLDEASFLATLGPKVGGLTALLAAVNPDKLKLVIAFGSIIGRAGLRGEADYATANDWLTDMTNGLAQASPECRYLALEWSVWSGAGMGEKLGVLESLVREGISPISVDDGIEMLRRLVATPGTPSSLVIMSRAGGLPTISLEPSELPLTRFIDRPRVHYPGVELVADVDLSADSDPYLADHLLDGDLLFPAVLGLEAMAQATAALTGSAGPFAFENLEFLRPIVVPPDGSTTIRIAAVNRGETVEVAIGSSDTGFGAHHFRATVRHRGIDAPSPERLAVTASATRVPLDPATDLYGGVFFQGKRFQRVLSYRRLAATSCQVDLCAGSDDQWFGPYLPAELLLGDPGVRDSFMHAIQCCVPNATLLPAGVERICPAAPADLQGQVVLHAAERSRVGDTYTYDLTVTGESGQVLERWDGLRLQAVRKTDGQGPWVPALLGPFLERQVADLAGGQARCAVEPDPVPAPDGTHARRRQTKAGIARMLDRPAVVVHRGDGKPEVAGADVGISASHGAGVTLAVAGPGRVGCDVETIRERTAEAWAGLLGQAQLPLVDLIERERGEELRVAATRVWSAIESLRKAGRALPGQITLVPGGPAGWVLLQAGQATIATFATALRDDPEAVVFTILTEKDGHGSVLRIPAHCGLRGNQPRRQRLLRQLRALAGSLPRDVPAGTRARGARRAARGPEAVHDQVRVRVPLRGHGLRRACHQDAPGGADADPDQLRVRLREDRQRHRGTRREGPPAGRVHARRQRRHRACARARATAPRPGRLRRPGAAAGAGRRYRGQSVNEETLALRSVLGKFATGVTVVTSGTNRPCGMTANSFTSVSLAPPLILVCITRSAAIYKTILDTGSFAVSILSADQEHLGRYFADHARPRGETEFRAVDWSPGPRTGAPVLHGALAWLECELANSYDGGDHEIFLGSVVASGHGPEYDALLYFRGGFHQPPSVRSSESRESA